ncbi:methyl-accepting chemotaxis protein [Paenibacillus alkalitolerans]|uniref:methyl-accepting chemotaxis protein n=1 Tax=Paenibacillus alkalitolerans TaxID=2799335 RepID=UPI0018F4A7DD|nr:methyl-accepting chemotaxis protein [Paenibacillus alkalitolerans]
MAWFKNMKIGTKLITSFVFIACIAGVIGVMGFTAISEIDERSQSLSKNYTNPITEMGLWLEGFNSIRIASRDVVFLVDDHEYQAKRAERIKELQQEMEPLLAEYEKGINSDEERAKFDSMINSYHNEFLPLIDRIVALGLADKMEEATRVLYDESSEVTSAINDAGLELMQMNARSGKVAADENTAVANRAVIVMISLAAAGMLIAIALGMYIARIISKPIDTLVQASRKIADGDMNVTIDIKSKDEIGVLAQAFTAMTESMNEVLHNINNAAEQVASGSRQVSEASQTLSQGSTEQASSIQQLTSSMEQIAAQTKQNAVSADQANQLAKTASTDAEQGNSQMKEMLTAMEDINEASGNISKIIKVIDEIAFQTNILALNAAVEAARAGQHGKGFAVVAEEVRNLAARSANAAKETTVLIEGSIKKVEAGTKIAHETAAALNKIVDGVNHAASLVGTIASASNEQAVGITQANQGISQVSDVIQANSATSEECAAASEQLSAQSDQLKEMVARFRLKRLKETALRSADSFSEQSRPIRASIAPIVARAEAAAATGGKVKIQLDDNGFGKYE